MMDRDTLYLLLAVALIVAIYVLRRVRGSRRGDGRRDQEVGVGYQASRSRHDGDSGGDGGGD